MDAKAPPVDKRRQILDAAIHVFARQGFHACRVSDIADEAGVAYGLVYHYFKSKDQMLNELFTRALVAAARHDRGGRRAAISAREKLDVVARFIIDSYRHEPELMKVIIVDVTRAANSFGRTHLPEIRRAYDLIAKIVADAQAGGSFRRDVDPEFASMWFYGAIEQLLSGWVFDLIPGGEADFDRAREMLVETICGGLEARDGGGSRRLMWESLGTTCRQDRAAARCGEGAERRRRARSPCPCGWSGSGSPSRFAGCSRGSTRSRCRCRSPQPRERSMDALMADLEAIPNGLRHSEAAMVRKGLPNMSTFVLANQREAANLGYAYPAQFTDHVFEGADGERIAASVGLHEGGGGRD